MSARTVKRALERLLESPPDDWAALLAHNPQLLTAAVDEPLAYLIDAARRDGDDLRVLKAENLEELLRAARRVGPGATLAELGGDEAHAAGATDPGYEFWELYRKTHEADFLDAAIERWEEALAATAPDSPDFAAAANNVASGLGARYATTHAPDDLRRAIDASEQTLSATAPAAPERATRLSNWAGLELQLFSASGDAAHLERALDGLREAAEATPPGSPERARCLTNLAGAHYSRYEQTRRAADLDALIDAAEEAVRLTAPGSSDYAERQDALAVGLERRYLDRDDAAALDRALDAWEEAIEHHAPGAPVPLDTMFAGGRAAWRRHRLTGGPQDRVVATERLGAAYIWGRDDARPLLDELLATARESDPALDTFLDRLGYERAAYERTHSLHALDAAIRGWEAVLASPVLRPENRAWRAAGLSDMGQALWARFDARGADDDMNAAIAALDECVRLTPPDAPNLTERRSNLGMALSVRAALASDPGGDLARAQELLEAAVADDLRADRRAALTRNLAAILTQTALRGPAEHAVDVLSHAIELLGAAMDGLERGSPQRTATALARAAARLELYDRTREPATLQQAIRELEKQRPDAGSAEETQQLVSLARALVDRHTLHGKREDLDRGIALLERAVDAASEDSRLEPVLLEELGLARLRRGAALDRLSDFGRAVDALAAAVDASEPDSLQLNERRGCLGVAMLSHAARANDAAEFARAVELLRAAEQRLPAESRRRPLVLNALADALPAGTASDRDESARLREEARTLDPGDPAAALSTGNALLRRYEATGTAEDLDEAVAAFASAAAVELNPQYRARCRAALGCALAARYRRNHDAPDRRRALRCFRDASALTLDIDPMTAFLAAQSWAELEVEDSAWKEAAEPYRLGLEALTRLLAARALRAEKEAWLRKARGFAADAAFALAFAGERRQAVVALEQSRALLLTDVLRREQFFLERLQHGHAALARRYELAAERVAALETGEDSGAATRRPARSSPADELRGARSALDAALAEIRALPGHDDLFATASFDDVATLAGGSRVVYLAAGRVWGAAFVVDGEALPPLLLQSLVTDRVASGTGYHLAAYDARAEDPARWRGQLDLTLGWLWDVAIGPLLDSGYLGRRRDGRAQPVVLVPLGPLALLPLHAAWASDDQAPSGRRYALDELCVTYAPNVRVLAEARRRARRRRASRLLAVEEPRPVRAGPLGGAAAEVAAAAKAIPDATILRHEDATVANVLAQLRDCTIAHFACHGRAEPEDPLASFLLLANDERLTLRTVMEQRGAELGLVVLSACETAVVGHELPDEVVGLPAGLLRAGVGGVIASSWSVPDVSTAILLTRFYELLDERGGGDAAEALRLAQQWVRDSSNGEKLEATPELMSAAIPASGRRLWERAHGHRHPYFWAGFSYVGG